MKKGILFGIVVAVVSMLISCSTRMEKVSSTIGISHIEFYNSGLLMRSYDDVQIHIVKGGNGTIYQYIIYEIIKDGKVIDNIIISNATSVVFN